MKTATFQLFSGSRACAFLCLFVLASCQKDDFYEKEYLENPYQEEPTTGGADGGYDGAPTTGGATGGGTVGGATGGTTTGGATTGGTATGATTGGGTSGGTTTGTTTGGTTTGTSTGGTTTGTSTGGSTTGTSTGGATTGTSTGGTTTGTSTGGSTTGSTTGTSTGGGTTGGHSAAVESFLQNAAPKLDILWVIDNSGSMSDEQASLGQNFDAFIGDFVDSGVDFKMAITTTDTSNSSTAGTAVSGSMTKLTSAKAQANRNQFLADFDDLVTVGTSGSGYEKGLAASKRFTERYQASWMRSDAYLIVVYLSDEEDQSSQTPAHYLAALQATKSNAGYVKAYSIVGMTGCPANVSGYTCGYARYQHMADNSGGSTANITGNFASILSGIGDEVSELLDSFPLAHDPVAGSVSVTVNGAPVASGWSVTGRQVKFDAGHVPAAGSSVQVSYQY